MKKLLIAALFASSAFFSGGVASADPCFWTPDEWPHYPEPGCPLTAQCRYNSVAQETATGGQDTFTGVASGFVIAQDPTVSVSVGCAVRVNGADVASTPTGSGTVFATSQGQVTYTATDSDDVDLCTNWTHGSNSGSYCVDTTVTQVPPQPVIDLLVLVTSIPDPIICPILGSLAPGVPGVVDITPQGDVSVAGEGVWDCPPYEV